MGEVGIILQHIDLGVWTWGGRWGGCQLGLREQLGRGQEEKWVPGVLRDREHCDQTWA